MALPACAVVVVGVLSEPGYVEYIGTKEEPGRSALPVCSTAKREPSSLLQIRGECVNHHLHAIATFIILR